MPNPADKPMRVHVPYGKRPPKGVLWASGVVLYHKRKPSLWSQLQYGLPDEVQPARLDALRSDIHAYWADDPRFRLENFEYYRGRNLACPYRCPLDSKECPVDVLIEEINKLPPKSALPYFGANGTANGNSE